MALRCAADRVTASADLTPGGLATATAVRKEIVLVVTATAAPKVTVRVMAHAVPKVTARRVSVVPRATVPAAKASAARKATALGLMANVVPKAHRIPPVPKPDNA